MYFGVKFPILVYMGSVVTNPHANAADAGSLGGEDPLEKGMETHSSFLSWEIT